MTHRVDAMLRAKAFADLGYCLMVGKSPSAALEVARSMRSAEGVLTILKSAVGGMNTTDDHALAALQQLSDAFVGYAEQLNIFDAILPDCLPGALHASFAFAATAATGSATLEGRAKSVTRLTAARGTLAERKATAMLVLSNALLRFSPVARALIERVLRDAVLAACDAIVVPAILSDAASISGTGLDAGGIRHDLRLALDALPTGAQSRLHLAINATVLKRLAVLSATTGAPAFPGLAVNGGTIGGIPTHPSDQVTDALLVDASAYAAAADPIAIRTSIAGSIEMDDAPSSGAAVSGTPKAPVESNLVSLFMNDSAAILAERLIAIEPLRLGAVRITGAENWGKEGSPPA